MEETVDILMATYNTNEKYLKEQIDSILNQTYANIKLHISDDASPNENIVKILEEYQKKDDRIIIYKHDKNQGFNANFEYLLKQSNARYIMFSDHDDIWYPEKVEKSLAKIKQNEVSMVYTNAKQIDENGNIIQNNYFKYKNIVLIKGKSKLAISRCAGNGCTQIITKEVKEKMLPFKQSVIAHDWLAGFIANEQKGIEYITEPLMEYRLHTSNVFGGRSLSQNLQMWKKENGKNYEAYRKYREQAIDNAYLGGAQMCLEYAEKDETKKFLEKLIKYYKKIKQTKVINFRIISYFKYLGGKNLLKKMCKEIVMFHMPILGYIIYKFL